MNMSKKSKEELCTLDSGSHCDVCEIKGKLACKKDKGIAGAFGAIGAPPMLITMIGFAIIGLLTGNWWIVGAYALFTFSMFGFIEMRFLCSHCPYYAAEGKVLDCLGNNGSLKIWKYRPGPMNGLERFLMRALVIGYFFIIPVVGYSYGIVSLAINYAQFGLVALVAYSGLAAASLLTGITFYKIVITFFCNVCVNFSCPYNSVPKKTVDAYLKMNPVMGDAWRKSGYQID